MAARGILIALAYALMLPAAQAAPCPVRSSWPTTSWPSRTEQQAAARAEQIAALEAYAFTLTGADAERRGIRTDAVVIVQGGEIVYERYARGHDASKRHLSWSVSKSFTNALVGLAVAEGRLQLDDSVCDHLPSLPQQVCGLKLVHLLEFSSGLDWKEVYENESNQASSVLAMLYGVGRRDMPAFVASHPFRDEPGTTWAYSSGDTNLLVAAVQAAMEPVHGPRFPWTLLFEPVGITSAVWERDGSGHLVGSSYLYATPRDLARFGYLFLNDGCWSVGRLLPEGWVEASTAVSAPFRLERFNRTEDDIQGRQWWINRPVPELGIGKAWPDVPEDAFAARGHWGQSITVIPSLDLVVVRTGDDREKAFVLNDFLQLAIEVGRP